MVGARSGGGRRGGGGGTETCSGVSGGTEACSGGGGGGNGGWTPSLAFLEQPLEREITPFFLQMTARVCEGGGGGGPFLSYRAHNGLTGEKAHLRPTTHNPKPKLLIENKGSQRERASRRGSQKGKNLTRSLKGKGK